MKNTYHSLESYLFVRLPHNGFFAEFYGNCSICRKIEYEGSSCLTYVQLLGHCAMSFNCFTVFFAPRQHTQRWRRVPLAGDYSLWCVQHAERIPTCCLKTYTMSRVMVTRSWKSSIRQLPPRYDLGMFLLLLDPHAD